MWFGAEKYSAPRDLAPEEQFAWVDCTPVYDSYLDTYQPTVDGLDMQLLHGGPVMLDNLPVWEAAQVARREARLGELRRREAEWAAKEAAVAAQVAAKAAAKAAKLDATRPAAEALLARVPAKGTTVTVGGVTGKVAWKGAKAYRGRWSARVGVKDARGEMHWVDAAAVVG